METVYGQRLTFKDVIIEFGSYAGPIIEAAFFSSDEAVYENRLGRYSNFNNDFFGEGDLLDFIETKIQELPSTVLVKVTYHRP